MFRLFREATQKLARGELSPDDQTGLINGFFELNEETQLLESIMDIHDELNIVHTLLSQQREVLVKLGQLTKGRNIWLSSELLTEVPIDIVDSNISAVVGMIKHAEIVKDEVRDKFCVTKLYYGKCLRSSCFCIEAGCASLTIQGFLSG